MKKILFASLATTLFLYGASAQADGLGTNITIYDGIGQQGGHGPLYEDNEAEPGMVQSQNWDLEGFFLNGSQLSIVGGYNFYTGYKGMDAGDIFIDIDGDAVYAPNIIPNYTYTEYSEVYNSFFKYDYVLDVDWDDQKYNIIKLTAESVLKDTKYGAKYNKASNPWIYLSGGTTVNTTTLTIANYNSGAATTINTGFSGMEEDNEHYVASFDLTGIDLSLGATFHNTMECGNDNLLGQAAPVPEPATMFLFGTGLAGLASVSRRRKKA